MSVRAELLIALAENYSFYFYVLGNRFAKNATTMIDEYSAA